MDPTTTALSGTTCSRCGYDLRGLDPSANCPECGQAIALSLATGLEHADANWLRRQSPTMLWLISVCLLEYSQAPYDVTSGYARVAFHAVFAIVAVVACWRLTTPDPRRAHTDGQAASARGLRLAIVVYAAGLLLYVRPPPVESISRVWMLLALAWYGALAISSWLVFFVVLQFARRTARRDLILHARIVVWALPLSKVLAFGTPLGIWFFNLFPFDDRIIGVIIVTAWTWAASLILLAAVALLGRMHEVFRTAAKVSASTESYPFPHDTVDAPGPT